MDRLEAVEIYLNTVKDNDTRLETKFYSIKTFVDKDYLLGTDIIETANYNSIYGLNSLGLGYPIIRMNEFESLFTGAPEQHSNQFSEKNYQLHKLNKNDVLICRTNGNPNLIGKSALVAKNYPYVYESHMFKVRPNRNYINSAVLVTYLNTKYGRMEIDRLSMVGNQANFSLAKFKELRIPKFESTILNQIEKIVFESFDLLEKSKDFYNKANKLLLKELDLLNFKPSRENIAIKSFKESFLATGRFDSEYYQPKYDEIMKHIKKTNFDKLDNIVNIKKSIEPGSEAYKEEGIPFVRVSNITQFGITDTDVYLSPSMFTEESLKKLYPTKDTILLSKDGTVGIAYKIKNEAEIITSSALLHLSIKIDGVSPEYLSLVLNSLIVQLQAERDAGGSIIKHWRPSEIENILIPIIDSSVQKKIEDNIKESFEIREKAKQLSEKAKRAVEIAIEFNENKAMEFLDGQQ